MSPLQDFVHLRLHSDYSIVDGLVKFKSLFSKLKALGMKSVALTDESNLFGAIKFYKAAIAAGIKPILGCDIWVQPDAKGKPCRLTLLCQNQQGYKNLTILISRAYVEAKRLDGLPIIPRNWLAKDRLQGLLAISGAQEGDIGRCLLSGNKKRAETWLKNWLILFPDNRFYIEIKRVGKNNEAAYIKDVLPLAAKFEVPVIASQDVRFIEKEDFGAHEVRVCINQGYTLEDPKRPKNYTAEQYLAPAKKMAELFSDIPEAIQNTLEIAKRCNLIMDLDKPQFPSFPVPNEEQTLDDYLIELSKTGLEERLIQSFDPNSDDFLEKRKPYDERLKMELDVICNMGFPGYFLVVADFIQWAKNNDIPVGPGRGSGAGSLVAYVLKITDLDPLFYDLLFERFLNPERVSLPDFDVDFCMDGRDRVIEYVAEKYGHANVSQIATFGTMAAKAVIRDVGRVLAHPYGFVDSIAKLIPLEIGMTLSKALEEEELFKERYDADEEVKAIVDMGLILEGTIRSVGKHAGGVVIAPTKLTDFTAIYCEEGTQHFVSQFDKNDVETAGLVKFDFLGLRNLTIIKHAMTIINAIRRENGEASLAIEDIPLDDKITFDLLKRCQTVAIFQLESRGMKDLIRRLQPDNFDDVMALVALFRPGPLQSGMVEDFINRKHGRAAVAYPHPDIVEVLKPTYGIIVYQEQVMQIPQILAGYSLGDADLLRRAMGKKKPEEMAKQRQIFMDGSKKHGVEDSTAEYLFDLMEKFAGYGFNKSHSAAYAMVSYQTAWLKAHYPAEFMAAVLSSDMDNTDKVVVFLEDCAEMELEVILPSVNKSRYKFAVDNGKVIFGLGAIKGLGESAIESIIAERKKNGPYNDFFDFCLRVDLRKVNKRALEALIWSGAMDTLGPSREAMFASIAKATQLSQKNDRDKSAGQSDLFGEAEEGTIANVSTTYVEVETLSESARLLKEKAILGLFFTGHPIKAYQVELATMHVVALSKLKSTARDATARLSGVVVSSRRLKTKRGKIMRIISLDDKTARVEVTIFEDVLDEYHNIIKIDEILVVEATVTNDEYSGGLRISGKAFYTVDEARTKYASKLHLKLTDNVAPNFLPKIQKLLQKHKGGSVPVEVHYRSGKASALLNLGEEWKVSLPEDLIKGLKELLGSERVVVEF